MRYKKNSIDYEVNLYAFHEMEQVVPMTKMNVLIPIPGVTTVMN